LLKFIPTDPVTYLFHLVLQHNIARVVWCTLNVEVRVQKRAIHLDTQPSVRVTCV